MRRSRTSTIEALAAQHPDLDLDHVEPAGVLGGVVELEAAQDAPGFGRIESLVEGAGRVARQVVLDDPDRVGVCCVCGGVGGGLRRGSGAASGEGARTSEKEEKKDKKKKKKENEKVDLI